MGDNVNYLTNTVSKASKNVTENCLKAVPSKSRALPISIINASAELPEDLITNLETEYIDLQSKTPFRRFKPCRLDKKSSEIGNIKQPKVSKPISKTAVLLGSAGMTSGLIVGTAICPIIGTVIGAVIGGLIGMAAINRVSIAGNNELQPTKYIENELTQQATVNSYV